MPQSMIAVPFNGDQETTKRWENHLDRKLYKWKKAEGSNGTMYHITIDEPMDAFWLGCNSVAILNKLFDGPLTITG